MRLLFDIRKDAAVAVDLKFVVCCIFVGTGQAHISTKFSEEAGKVSGIELRYRMLKQTPHGNSFFSDYSEVELLLLKRDLNKIGKGGKRNESV